VEATAKWAELDAHRGRLVHQAMLLGLTREEAEDVASEAILRGARHPHLDMSACSGWLHVVARRLAVDVHRRRPSFALLSRLAHEIGDAEDPHERTLERLEASWAAELVDALPPRQREVLRLRASGHPPAVIADHLECSYKTVESLTSRARATVRRAMAKALVLVCGIGEFARRAAHHHAGGALASSAMACLTLLVVGGVGQGTDAKAPQPGDSRGGRAGAAQPHARARGRLAPARVLRTGREPRGGAGSGRTEHPVLAAGSVGPLHHGGVRTTTSRDDESLVDSTLRCLKQGPVLSPSYVGCRSA
jgi:RNA polymerase sigma factor (sigma-70 family)